MAMILVLRQPAEIPPFLADRTLALQILDQVREKDLLASRQSSEALIRNVSR